MWMTLFRVNGSHATAAVAVSLEQAGLRERDLQEWVIAHPGDDRPGRPDHHSSLPGGAPLMTAT